MDFNFTEMLLAMTLGTVAGQFLYIVLLTLLATLARTRSPQVTHTYNPGLHVVGGQEAVDGQKG